MNIIQSMKQLLRKEKKCFEGWRPELFIKLLQAARHILHEDPSLVWLINQIVVLDIFYDILVIHFSQDRNLVLAIFYVHFLEMHFLQSTKTTCHRIKCPIDSSRPTDCNNFTQFPFIPAHYFIYHIIFYDSSLLFLQDECYLIHWKLFLTIGLTFLFFLYDIFGIHLVKLNRISFLNPMFDGFNRCIVGLL